MGVFDAIKAKFWLDTVQDMTGLDPLLISKEDLDTVVGEKLNTDGLDEILTLSGQPTADLGDEILYLGGDKK